MMEDQLNGTYRAVFDDVASADECKKLANLGLVGTIKVTQLFETLIRFELPNTLQKRLLTFNPA